jgi:hypothetical protein
LKGSKVKADKHDWANAARLAETNGTYKSFVAGATRDLYALHGLQFAPIGETEIGNYQLHKKGVGVHFVMGSAVTND